MSDVPFIDLRAQYVTIRDEIRAAVDDVFETQSFILGPNVEAFEAAVAERMNLPSAGVIGVSSGTDALLASLMALGVGPGDRVLTTPFSFFATAGVVARLHATPVFCDIDPVTMNLDPTRLQDFDPSDFKAMVVVHLFGRTANMAAIEAWATPAKLPIVEDAAQAILAVDGDGRRCGTLGDLGCFSFFPTKNLGAAGDGGAVTSRDPELAERVRLLRTHGAPTAYDSRIIGGNFRLDALQAAVLHVKLGHLDTWNRARLENAATYDRLFRADGLEAVIDLPPLCDDDTWIAHQYVVRVPRRDELKTALAKQGIGSAVYYPEALPHLECFAALGHRRGDFPEAERAAGSVLALPIFAELGTERLERVVKAVGDFYS